MMDITNAEFGLLREHLFRESGIDISDEKRYLFTTRLVDLLKKEKCRTFSDFYLLLTSGTRPALRQSVIEAMTTHESGFFRDGHPFQVFSGEILPKIAERKNREARFLPPRIRILSAGCSFGQEPYTIALCVRRWLSTQTIFTEQNVSIIGADISPRALDLAKKGRYSDLELGKQLSPEDRQRNFVRDGDHWILSDEIRKMVSFDCVNLTKPFNALGKFDVIFCRNVVIYFSKETKRIVLKQLRLALDPEGVLFIGSTESMYSLSEDFVAHTTGNTTFYKSSPQKFPTE